MPRTQPMERLGILGDEIRKQRLAKEKARAEVKQLRALCSRAADAINAITERWEHGDLAGAVREAAAIVPDLERAAPRRR